MWRTRALDARGQRIMAGPTGAETPNAPKSSLVAELAAELAGDPRMSAAKLGTRLGVSEATARRAVERASMSGRLGLGCDLAVPAAGLRRGAMLWARSSQPVSYTHLDVYKRQSIPRANPIISFCRASLLLNRVLAVYSIVVAFCLGSMGSLFSNFDLVTRKSS